MTTVIFQQYYLGCLSHASYLIGDEAHGRAVVVDPQRDVSAYLADASAAGLRIERVIETHFHADHVSGHLELAARTGASIWYGQGAVAEYDIGHLGDRERVSLGDVTLEVLATPGHTPESISIVVRERDGDPPHAVLTGDTLFIGDVGRPDLLAAAGTSPEQLARQLYRSLREKLLALPDATRVYPCHGAGSACGRSLSSETWSTIGLQRRTNYALAPMTEDEFVAIITEGQPVTPAYYAFDAQRNRQAHALLDETSSPRRLDLADVLAVQRSGGRVVDTRAPADFAACHLRGALHVGLLGRFAEYAGDIVTPDAQVALVCDEGTELEARNRLARIGYDGVAGCLRDPVAVFSAHRELVEPSSRLTVAELARRMDDVDALQLVDVRNPGELASGAIDGAVNIPLPAIAARIGELDPDRPTAVYCASGTRSLIASSLLAASGFGDVSDVLGGFDAWARAQASTRPTAGP